MNNLCDTIVMYGFIKSRNDVYYLINKVPIVFYCLLILPFAPLSYS